MWNFYFSLIHFLFYLVWPISIWQERKKYLGNYQILNKLNCPNPKPKFPTYSRPVLLLSYYNPASPKYSIKFWFKRRCQKTKKINEKFPFYLKVYFADSKLRMSPIFKALIVFKIVCVLFIRQMFWSIIFLTPTDL